MASNCFFTYSISNNTLGPTAYIDTIEKGVEELLVERECRHALAGG